MTPFENKGGISIEREEPTLEDESLLALFDPLSSSSSSSNSSSSLHFRKRRFNPRLRERESSCRATTTRLGSATPEPVVIESDRVVDGEEVVGARGVAVEVLNGVLVRTDLNGANGVDGATLIIATGLLGDNLEPDPILLLVLLVERRGRGLLSKLTFGRHPKPVYLGLKLDAPVGGLKGGDGLFWSHSLPCWMRAESLDENPGDLTSILREGGR